MGWLLTTSWGRNITAAFGLLAALLLALRAAEYRGRRTEAARQKAATAEATAEAHERMNHAPDLRDADDGQRIDWLRDYRSRHARP